MVCTKPIRLVIVTKKLPIYIYISSSELNVVTYNTRRMLRYAPPKPVGLDPQIFAGGLCNMHKARPLAKKN
jgi:hypothetical protein